MNLNTLEPNLGRKVNEKKKLLHICIHLDFRPVRAGIDTIKNAFTGFIVSICCMRHAIYM